jgi:hypothetical protein
MGRTLAQIAWVENSKMQYAALGASLAGTASQTIAGVRASNNASDLYKAEAQSELAAGEYNANLSRQQSKRVMGKARAVIGASGVDPGSGSPIDIMLESAKQAELEALTIQYQSKTRANQSRMRGQIAKAGAGNALAEGLVRGTTYFSDWYNKYGLTAGKSTTSSDVAQPLEEFKYKPTQKQSKYSLG